MLVTSIAPHGHKYNLIITSEPADKGLRTSPNPLLCLTGDCKHLEGKEGRIYVALRVRSKGGLYSMT